MYLNQVASFLGWCTVINFALLMFTAIVIFSCRNIVLNIHSRLSGVSRNELTKLYFSFLSYYKLAIIMLNFVPYLALRIILL